MIINRHEMNNLMVELDIQREKNTQRTRIFDQFSDLHQAYNGRGERDGRRKDEGEGREPDRERER